jgi:hypothetical protein
MTFDGYNGDWAIWTCDSNECESEVQKPVADASDKGFTMESLGRVSDYIDSTN